MQIKNIDKLVEILKDGWNIEIRSIYGTFELWWKKPTSKIGMHLTKDVYFTPEKFEKTKFMNAVLKSSNKIYNIRGDVYSENCKENKMTKNEIRHIIREEINLLLEKDYKELRNDDPTFLRRRERSKQTPGSQYVGLLKNNMTVLFTTHSHTDPNKVYKQKVKLLDLPKLIKQYKGTKSNIEIVQMAIEGDLGLYCDDPSWKYWGYEYKADKEGYGIHKQNIYPKERNPQLKGSMCKHLENVLLILPFITNSISRELKNRGV